jgi:UDP-N-acetylglucosamine/UDP-N-acetylgalactosamine diphosphorylase
MLMTVSALQERGVKILSPESVFVGLEVHSEAIAPGVIIYPGCRLQGKHLSIGPNCVIGQEAPVTMDDCQLGAGVALAGGYFKGSVFLDGASMGSGAHVRPGCLLEEQASGAHSVGFKQTIFLPYVTAGSLINFCDVLMAGGESRKRHSEIGSSYVHFNFTPHGDKATASLIGDVPRGVMMNQPPIFLGGQGGLVGPVQIAYGTVLGAGSVNRKDVLEPGRLVIPPAISEGLDRSYNMAVYKEVERRVLCNLTYIGNLTALNEWYCWVRELFVQGDPYKLACHEGALRLFDQAIHERVHRMSQLVEKVTASLELIRAGAETASEEVVREHERLVKYWPGIIRRLRDVDLSDVDVESRGRVVTALENHQGVAYIEAVDGLSVEMKAAGTQWLQAIVDRITGLWTSIESEG